MKNQWLSSLLLGLLFCSPAAAQVTEEWVARYSGLADGWDFARDLELDEAGNVYIAGCSEAAGTGWDILIVKYNPQGEEIWRALWNGPGNERDEAFALKLGPAGAVYAAGYCWGGASGNDFITLKYDSSGTLQWAEVHNGPANGDDAAQALVVTDDGGVCVTGYRAGSGGGSDWITIRYSPDGQQLWTRRYSGLGSTEDQASSLAQDIQGSLYVTGFGQFPAGGKNYLTIKYAADGTQEWMAHYNGPGNGDDLATWVQVDAQGCSYVTGKSMGISSNFDLCTLKYDAQGNQIWVYRYDSGLADDDGGDYLTLDDAGFVYVTGPSWGGATQIDWVTIKCDSSGAEEWTARYNGAANGPDGPQRLAVDEEGSVFVTGANDIDPNPNVLMNDYATVKYNSAGVQQWVQQYNGSGNNQDGSQDIVVDEQGNLFITGGSAGLNTGCDCATIKYSPINFAQPGSGPIVSLPTSAHCSIRPNPFNAKAILSYDLRAAGDVNLNVYDLAGRWAATLVNGWRPKGRSEAVFDGATQPSGIYIYRLQTGDFTASGKMVLMK